MPRCNPVWGCNVVSSTGAVWGTHVCTCRSPRPSWVAATTALPRVVPLLLSTSFALSRRTMKRAVWLARMRQATKCRQLGKWSYTMGVKCCCSSILMLNITKNKITTARGVCRRSQHAQVRSSPEGRRKYNYNTQ